ncbi:hypothetical protein [Neobacillus mesonae]|uniref:hypothetical protein n=1 Tax=Neobacillus mesonae TaxID=1193713 RepID=UPI00203EEF07|nr:hypothetical protein [Neobacillus mesonae]MCM3569934.1 hypothetical protein [Neobacillus mesonae]
MILCYQSGAIQKGLTERQMISRNGSVIVKLKAIDYYRKTKEEFNSNKMDLNPDKSAEDELIKFEELS